MLAPIGPKLGMDLEYRKNQKSKNQKPLELHTLNRRLKP
jgi:hypothetical protein